MVLLSLLFFLFHFIVSVSGFFVNSDLHLFTSYPVGIIMERSFCKMCTSVYPSEISTWVQTRGSRPWTISTQKRKIKG